ncbi:type II restriction enzyme [Clostridium tagluense]|uniref:type II restriction enzyme n=1 Tax=Clostridium tagluense TaxID=360422 RepID=UPI001C0DCA8B|nr:transcriptional regulator [Clostridium tagluense]MBU3129003.1 transcriptional regulator [Clostridium tagluense]
MSNKPKTKNDTFWEKIFDKYNIINSVNSYGSFEITAGQINEFREARLMTKFDHKNSLPQLFEQHQLSILPITRGNYIIAPFEAYHILEKPNHKIQKLSFPNYIQSINYENITSEATAINTAYVSGIFADFTGDEELLPTVSGRMSSDIFDFTIKNSLSGLMMPLNVKNSQVEIDGGYEGLNALALIEAKNSISDDFLVRQLYYPYRLWQKKMRKPVKPIFLMYSNGIFRLNEYVFEDPTNYNSIKLVKQKNYSIEPEDITLDDILDTYKSVKLVEEPHGIPFPQANSFRRVINLCELIYENDSLTRDEITNNYDFDTRQTNYYTDACRYLGLIGKSKENGTAKYFLTEKGKSLFSINIRSRNLKFVQWILQHKAFYLTFKQHVEEYMMPSIDEIVEIMKVSNLYKVDADSTFGRRASSISGWINWIMDLSR